MNSFIEYQRDALRTKSESFHVLKLESSIGSTKFRDIFHASIGMVTEAGELMEAFSAGIGDHIDFVNLDEEAGDFLWYCAIYCGALGTDFYEITGDMTYNAPEVRAENLPKIATELVVLSANLMDLFKKALFYGKPVDFVKADGLVCRMILTLETYAMARGTSLVRLAERNINKLRTRYPEKFTEQDANVRNLDAERASLEACAIDPVAGRTAVPAIDNGELRIGQPGSPEVKDE